MAPVPADGSRILALVGRYSRSVRVIRLDTTESGVGKKAVGFFGGSSSDARTARKSGDGLYGNK